MPLSTPGAKITETFGYTSGSEVPVFTKTYTTDGTCTPGGAATPGDVTGLIRYSTAARSSKNHPIYLFNYYHAVAVGITPSTVDVLTSTIAAAYAVYAGLWVSTGFSDGSNTYKRSSPNGHDATGFTVEPLVTHRDLPR